MNNWPTDRIVLYDRSLTCIGELAKDEIRKRERTEEINGTHELVIVTTRVLREGTRLLTVDGTGKWREHVVYKTPESHKDGRQAVGTYTCKWSLQYDLESTYAKDHAEPGMGSSCTSTNAVRAAIDGQAIWGVGACDVPAVAAGKGRVMIGKSGWDRLKLVVDAWGGEVDAEITVDATGVVSRNVALRAHLGSTEVKRRFDWAKDLTEINRDADPGPYFCRIIPLGRGQREYAEDDETEFEWPLDISEETPDGRVYIQDDEAAAVFRTADGHGGYHYPSKVVKYDEDDPELLLNAGTEDLHNHTRPNVAYEADVLQFVEAGMDVQGVELGDETQCADWGFNPDESLCVQGRITRMVVNELAPKTDTKLTLGNLSTSTSLSQMLMELIGSGTQSITSRINMIEGGGTIAYVENLLDAINAMIAADGGYTYLAPGEGSITYDKAVADPLVGTEATRVTQMKGGSVRFAKAKKPGFSGINDWDWTNVITPDGYLGLAATIAAITTGFIGNSSGSSYLYLDDGELYLSGGSKLTDALDDACKVATNYLSFSTGTGLDVGYNGTNAKTRINASGMEAFDGNGVSEAVFNALTARIGRSDKEHITITPGTGIELFDKDNVSEAEFSNATARVGRSDKAHATITPLGGMEFYDENAVSIIKLNASGARMGKVNGSHLELTPNHINMVGVESGGLEIMSNPDLRYPVTVWDYGMPGDNHYLATGSIVADRLQYAASNVTITAICLFRNYAKSATFTRGTAKSTTIYATESSAMWVRVAYDGAKTFTWQRWSSSSSEPGLLMGVQYDSSVPYHLMTYGVSSTPNPNRGAFSTVLGLGLYAQNDGQLSFGKFNVDQSGVLMSAGYGSSETSRKNALKLETSGDLWIAGALTQNSDRRLKKHHVYLGEEACEFVRKLKPALYEKDGGRHVGFYAQDVRDAEPDGWDTVTVTSQHTDESLDFDPLTLDYQALIAPLVAYAQQLERRIAKLEGGTQ